MKWFDDLRHRLRAAWLKAGTPPVAGATRWARLASLPRSVLIALAAVLLLLVYYGPVGWLMSGVDADLTLRPDPASLPPGGSVAVGMAARLMEREVEEEGWTPNDPFFFPTALLDDRPAFQRGAHAMITQFAIALRDLGGDDPDLDAAAAAFSQSPDRWWLRSEWPFFGASAESEYRDGIAALRRYNARVGQDQAQFERQGEMLIAALDQIALRLGSAAAATERQVQESAGRMIDTHADDQFNEVRGQTYAAALLLRGLREDYAPVIRERQLGARWVEMAESLDALVADDPLIVSSGSLGGLFRNHLTEQGYYLLLARNRLREITAVLQQ